MATLQQLLKIYFLLLHIILVIWFFRNLTFTLRFPAANWAKPNWGCGNADMKSMNTSVEWEGEDDQVPETYGHNRYDMATKIRFENMIGGPPKVFEYFRDQVFKKKCEQEKEEYSEAKAEKAWREMSESKRDAYRELAVIFYMKGEYDLEEYPLANADVDAADYGL